MPPQKRHRRIDNPPGQGSYIIPPMPRDQLFDPDDFRMPLGEHLEELRGCLVRGILGLVVALILTFYYGFQIIAWLAQPMLQVMRLRGYPEQLITTDATAGFGTYIKVSFLAALIVASPWVIYQAWKFVATGLYAREKKVVYILAPFSTLMTALAVAFVYYLLLPAGMWFFFGWADHYPKIEYTQPSPFIEALAKASGVDMERVQEFDTAPLNLPVLEASPETPAPGDVWINGRTGKMNFYVNGREYSAAIAPASMLAPLPNLGDYVKFASMVCLGIVIAFQTPVVMLIVGWTGTIDPAAIKKMRKYALMACAVAGAVLTPSDPFTMLLLGIPLYCLFEFGLFLMGLVYKEPEPFDPEDPFGMKEAGENWGSDTDDGGPAEEDPIRPDGDGGGSGNGYTTGSAAGAAAAETQPVYAGNGPDGHDSLDVPPPPTEYGRADDIYPEDLPEDPPAAPGEKNLGRSGDVYESTAAFDPNSLGDPWASTSNTDHELSGPASDNTTPAEPARVPGQMDPFGEEDPDGPPMDPRLDPALGDEGFADIAEAQRQAETERAAQQQAETEAAPGSGDAPETEEPTDAFDDTPDDRYVNGDPDADLRETEPTDGTEAGESDDTEDGRKPGA